MDEPDNHFGSDNAGGAESGECTCVYVEWSGIEPLHDVTKSTESDVGIVMPCS